tara:strand:- start:2633 stop:3337 length:705 start_codon:yes stop_codon:yes gene_type:complete
MIEKADLETYLFLLPNKFLIILFDTKNLTNYYINEVNLENKINFIDVNFLNKFLDENIFKIEKQTGKFIKNIFIVIENNQIFKFNIGIKKKNYDKLINKKYLENSLIDIKELFNENYKDKKIMHIIIDKYLIDGKLHSLPLNNLNGNNFCLEIQIRSLSASLTYEIEKVLEKYQIRIIQYLDGNYIRNFFKDSDLDIAQMTHNIKNGINENEVKLVPKNTKNVGFFEKFFQLFN